MTNIPENNSDNFVTIHFLIWKDETKVTIQARIGSSVLDVAHDNDIPLEGACCGALACSTCHVVLTQGLFDILEPASFEEEDMLDMAFNRSCTSRLGCQIVVTENMDNSVFKIPTATRNINVNSI